MKKGILAIALLSLAVLSSVSAAVPLRVNCSSSSPEILILSYIIEDGKFSITLQNLAGGAITLLSADPKNQFVIESRLEETIPSEGLLEISGSYPSDASRIEVISLQYIDPSGQQQEATISCQGRFYETNTGASWWYFFTFVLPAILIVIGIICVLYDYFKKNKKIQILGLILLAIAVILFLELELLFIPTVI